MFFQAALLAGYLYAHFGVTRRRIGWDAVAVDTPMDIEACHFPARWVLLSPDAARIAHFRKLGATAVPARQGFNPWTDEHASLLPILQ